MTTTIIEFKGDPDIEVPQPWPVGIAADNTVTSGLGRDDGAAWIGFSLKGEMSILAMSEDFDTLDFENQDIVPVFAKDGAVFNWNVPIRAVTVKEIQESR